MNTRNKLPVLGIVSLALLVTAQFTAQQILGPVIFSLSIILGSIAVKTELAEPRNPNPIGYVSCIIVALVGAFLLHLTLFSTIFIPGAIWCLYNIRELNLTDPNSEGGD